MEEFDNTLEGRVSASIGEVGASQAVTARLIADLTAITQGPTEKETTAIALAIASLEARIAALEAK